MARELLLGAVAAACVLATVGVVARARGAGAATRLIVLAAVAWSASRLLGWQGGAPASADLGATAALGLVAVALPLVPGGPHLLSGRARTWADGLIVAGSALFVAWVLGLEGLFESSSAPDAGLALVPAPAATMAAGIAVVLLTRARDSARPGFAFLTCGLAAVAAAEWLLLGVRLEGTSTLVPLAVLLAAGGWLVAALARDRFGADEEDDPGLPTSLSVVVPSLPLAAGLAAGAVQVADSPAFPTELIWAGLVVILAIIARQVLALLESIGFWRELETVIRSRDVALQASQEVEEELARRALHDPLTGLPNRALLLDRAEHALARREPDSSLAMLFIDLDGFKEVNDTLGHQVGDDLLVAVGRRLSALVGAGDTVARLGGDEFAVLAQDVADEREATTLAARLRDAVQQPFRAEGIELRVRASIGVGISEPAGGAPEEAAVDLLRRADMAMYSAKSHGGSDWRLYESRMRRDARERLERRSGLTLVPDSRRSA